MIQKNEHTRHNAIDQQSKAFFKGGKFLWEKSEANVWSDIEAKIEAEPSGKVLRLVSGYVRWAIAASILVLLGIGTFMRYYKLSIETNAGEHQLVFLPDGSSVDLNAESSISYKPYWWRFNREIKFEGEAYFEVEKGKKFSVKSNKGITEVLGTSFNIFSREEVYKVTCLTGKVRVTSTKQKSVILLPNSKAEIKLDGNIELKKDIETFPEISWKNNIFLFTAAPLCEVFSEIERQFGVTISTQIDSYALYTGNFNKSFDVEEILSYVCPALGLEYIRKSNTEYEIIQDSE